MGDWEGARLGQVVGVDVGDDDNGMQTGGRVGALSMGDVGRFEGGDDVVGGPAVGGVGALVGLVVGERDGRGQCSPTHAVGALVVVGAAVVGVAVVGDPVGAKDGFVVGADDVVGAEVGLMVEGARVGRGHSSPTHAVGA